MKKLFKLIALTLVAGSVAMFTSCDPNNKEKEKEGPESKLEGYYYLEPGVAPFFAEITTSTPDKQFADTEMTYQQIATTIINAVNEPAVTEEDYFDTPIFNFSANSVFEIGIGDYDEEDENSEPQHTFFPKTKGDVTYVVAGNNMKITLKEEFIKQLIETVGDIDDPEMIEMILMGMSQFKKGIFTYSDSGYSINMKYTFKDDKLNMYVDKGILMATAEDIKELFDFALTILEDIDLSEFPEETVAYIEEIIEAAETYIAAGTDFINSCTTLEIGMNLAKDPNYK